MQISKESTITEMLFRKYPNPEISLNFSNPLELLIATILSAQCTDKRVNEVTNSLFKKYKSAKDYADANISELESEIRSTGFFKNKSKSIINCCRIIITDYNGRVPSTLKELIKLPGVGRKTANVVLSGAFGKEAIAVDTHMLRVGLRLGLTSSNKPDRVEQDLMNVLPSGNWSKFNIALILFGRETCKARRPLCGECVLSDECNWPDKIKFQI